MVRNGFWLWYEMVMVQNTYGMKLQFCGTKWLWCKIHMVRNGFWLWCKIHMVRNCNFVVRNGKLWYEMAMVRNGYGTK